MLPDGEKRTSQEWASYDPPASRESATTADSPWQSRDNFQMHRSRPNQAAKQNKTETGGSEERPQSAAAPRSLHTEPTGEP